MYLSPPPATKSTSTRKIAIPTKKFIPPVPFSATQNLTSLFQPLNITDATPTSEPPTSVLHTTIAPTKHPCITQPTEQKDDAEADLIAAWSDLDDIRKTYLFEKQVKVRRNESYAELWNLLDAVTVYLRRGGYPGNSTDIADPCSLTWVCPMKVARAWEKDVWCAHYTTAFDLNAYNTAMTKDIADLRIWVENWPGDLGGENVFRERMHRQFGSRIADVMVDEEGSVQGDAMSVLLAAMDGEEEEEGKEGMASLVQMSACEMEFDFAKGPIVSGAAAKLE
ncbi:hypothetical protein G6011_05832 [Alternaria panax]|uniref:Uncharacterized protein n=1 Tax=Alternaria panax TaxID=48097 RepID=A0AAD4FEC7_9PLEO|nr:hypothetical protein G6011_05832 [Alternaria panax]